MPILIHASKGLHEQYYDFIKSNTNSPLPSKDKLEYGGVVGIEKLVLCWRPGELPADISREQRAHSGSVH